MRAWLARALGRSAEPRFARFARRFRTDGGLVPVRSSAAAAQPAVLRGDPALIAFLAAYPGVSFNRGIYRSLAMDEIAPWTDRVAAAYPAYAGRICPFGHDWLNRIYCVDFAAVAEGPPTLVMFSLLNDLVIDIPLGIEDFHNQSLVAHYDEALEAPLFAGFLAATGQRGLERHSCASMHLPLFLGGEYELANMETADSVVDWELGAQMLEQVRCLDEGAIIEAVSLGRR